MGKPVVQPWLRHTQNERTRGLWTLELVWLRAIDEHTFTGTDHYFVTELPQPYMPLPQLHQDEDRVARAREIRVRAANTLRFRLN
jgi:hypothetical protein